MVGVEGISGGAVNCVEIEKNTNDESIMLGQHWHWEMKASEKNGINTLVILAINDGY